MGRFSRSLEPEWLDHLPPDDPRAVRSRADLRRVNAVMGNARIIARHLGQASRVADLGGGDGSLMRAVARRLGRELEVTIDRKSTRLNSSHSQSSYAVVCLKKKSRNAAGGSSVRRGAGGRRRRG